MDKQHIKEASYRTKKIKDCVKVFLYKVGDYIHYNYTFIFQNDEENGIDAEKKFLMHINWDKDLTEQIDEIITTLKEKSKDKNSGIILLYTVETYVHYASSQKISIYRQFSDNKVKKLKIEKDNLITASASNTDLSRDLIYKIKRIELNDKIYFVDSFGIYKDIDGKMFYDIDDNKTNLVECKLHTEDNVDTNETSFYITYGNEEDTHKIFVSTVKETDVPNSFLIKMKKKNKAIQYFTVPYIDLIKFYTEPDAPTIELE